MAGEEMDTQSGERRRRSRAGSNLNVNFNGGGVVLLLGAAAGALLASAFAAHRVRAHKRRRGSMKEVSQGEHLADHEAKEFVGDEGGEGVCQVNPHDNLDASVQISQVDQREIDFYLLGEGKGEAEGRSPTIDVELVDGERGEVAGFRESSADISSFPANGCRNLGGKQLRYDHQGLVAATVKEGCNTSCVNCKKEDEEDNEKSYIEEDEREEIEEKMISSNLHSEQPRLLEKKTSQNLETVTSIEEGNFEDGSKDELYNPILELFVSRAKEVATSTPGDQDEMNSFIKEVEPFFEGSEAEKALDMTLNDSGKHPEMVMVEDEIRMENGGFKDDGILDTSCVKQNSKEGEAFDDKMVERSSNLCEQIVALPHESSFTAISEPKTASRKDSVMVMDKEDFLLIAHINGIIHTEEDKKGAEESNYPSADEGNDGLIDETQGTEFLHLGSSIRDDPIMIMAVEEKTQLEDNTTCGLNNVIQEEKTEESLLNGFKENVEQSETDEDVQLVEHINDVVHIETDVEEEESNYPSADEGVGKLMDEAEGTTHPTIGSPLKKEAWPNESCIRDNPTMITAVEEKTQLEDTAACELHDVIHEHKTEENLFNGLKENVESSEAEEKLRENEERPLTESQRIKFSLEQDNLMAYNESSLTQFQGIEPVVREDKACLDRFTLSLESNIKIVQPIQDTNLNNSEKTLEIEESHLGAGAEESETSRNEEVEERDDEAISSQYHELQTMQHIEAHKDKLEREIEHPQTLPLVEQKIDTHKESKAQIKEEEGEQGQILKLSFVLMEKGVEILAKTIEQEKKTELIDVDKEHHQVEGHANNVPSKGNQQRIATKKVKGTEYMFMGYPKGHIFLLTALATAFAVMAFLYTKDFFTRTTILENFTIG